MSPSGTGLVGWADRIRTSRRRFVEQPSTTGERTHNVSGLHVNSAGISVGWTKRHLEVRILSAQPGSPVYVGHTQAFLCIDPYHWPGIFMPGMSEPGSAPIARTSYSTLTVPAFSKTSVPLR